MFHCLYLPFSRMEHVRVLNTINWDHVVSNNFKAAVQLTTEVFFRTVRVKGDGNCFYRSLAVIHSDKGSEEDHLFYRMLIPEVAEKYFELEPEALLTGKSKEEYISLATCPGEWAGSLEASMLSKFLDITVIIWCADEAGVITHAIKFGTDIPSNSFHLLMTGNTHFDALIIRGVEVQQKGLQLDLLDKLESIEELEIECEADLLPSLEKPAMESTPSEGKAKDIEVYHERGENIPVRVGRLIELFFSCRLGFVIEGSVLLLTNLIDEQIDKVMDVRQLGRTVLNSDRSLRKEFANLILNIDDNVLNYADFGTLLRIVYPGQALNRFVPFILDWVLVEILHLSTAILLSFFLYKSKPKQKKLFIINCCSILTVGTQKVVKALRNINSDLLYKKPAFGLAQVCDEVYGSTISTIKNLIKKLSGSSQLLLRNVDFSRLSLSDYLNLLKELGTEDNRDRSYSNFEVRSLHQLRERLEKLESQGVGCMAEWYPDWKSTKKNDSKQQARQYLIQNFFNEKELVKFISKSGKASGCFQIGNVLSYAYNLYLSKDSLQLADEDIEQLIIDIRNLTLLQETEIGEPVAVLCEKLEPYFYDAFRKLNLNCKDECIVLFDDIRNSISHAVSWKHALRLKGVMYEGYFSDQMGWNYLPEDLKPSLIMAIQTLFPEKFQTFLERTQLHPEFRDITPDFLITQRLILEPSVSVVKESKQLVVTEGTLDSVRAVPIARSVFPLPEVAVPEIDSIQRTIEHFIKLAESSNSKRNRFNCDVNDCVYDDEDKFSKYQLLFVEVGYQTDVEGKVMTDTAKWKEVLKLLSLIGIKASLIVCVDCSRTPVDDWWISEDKVRLLKSSISHLFAKLSVNSPSDVTDMVIGSVSTLKIRSFLKSGSNTKTPLSTKDVHETWNSMKNFIVNRPTGVTIPSEVEQQLFNGLVQGATISEEGANEIVNMIKDNLVLITDEFEKTKYCSRLNRSKQTSLSMVLAWLKEDLESCRCSECFLVITDEASKMVSLESKAAYLAKSCILVNHLPCCHPNDSILKNFSTAGGRVPDLSSVGHASNISLDDSDMLVTDLDRITRLILPGKTEKEKKIKRSVDCLIKLMMLESDINCIKLPSGQLVSLDNNTKIYLDGKKNVNSSSIAKKNASNRKDVIFKNLQDDKLVGYSNHVKKIIKESLDRVDKQKGSKCELRRDLMDRILVDLNVPLKNEDIVNKIRDTFNKRKNFKRNNDKLLIRSAYDIADYIDRLGISLHREVNHKIFSLDCLLFKEVISEAMMRYWSTAYQDCPGYIVHITEFMLNFEWFHWVVLYSKICETFLRICTEFNRAGIKLLKVRHTDINIAVKLPSNKKKNMLCVLYDKDMNLIKKPFFLNRRQAVLGAAYPYIILVLYVQVLQHFRCIELLLQNPQSILDPIRNRTLMLLEEFKKESAMILNGQFEDANILKQSLCNESGNFLNKSAFEVFINTISGLNMVYGLIMRDSFLANSQPQNKQLQMLRYGMLNGLSRVSCPEELGKKFSSSCRRIEDNLSRIYLQSVIYSSNRNPENNIKEWQSNDLCPKTGIPCFSVYGMHVVSDRQLIFDIYNVHIYNKEMDDFEEGCIQVLEETSDRHMRWESMLNNAIQSKEYRLIRLLTGAPNIHTEKNREELELAPFSESGDDKSNTSSTLSRRSSSRSKSSYKCNFSTHNTLRKTITLSDGFTVVPDSLRKGRPVITGGPQTLIYTPSNASVLKDILSIIKLNPNFTLGSFELIQAAVEFAKFKYPPESIDKARKNPKNWTSVSEVTETTSIIAAPKTVFSIKEALNINLNSDTKKIAKMLRNKLKRLGSLFTDNDASRTDCQHMLSTVTGLSKEQKENIVNAIFTPSKLALYNWKNILEKKLTETILTHDGNIVYCWIKSLSLMVKNKLSKQLKFMNPGSVSIAKHNLFSTDELNDLLKVKDILTTNNSNILNINSRNIISSWLKCFYLNVDRLPPLTETFKDVLELSDELFSIRLDHSKLAGLKRNNKFTSFVREEMQIKSKEKTFLNKWGSQLVKLSNLIFYSAVSAPWCFHYKALESYLVRNPELLDIKKEGVTDNPILSLSTSHIMMQVLLDQGIVLTSRTKLAFKFLIEYLVTMFSSNAEPFGISLSDDTIGVKSSSDIEEKLLYQTKKMFAKLGLSDRSYDFIWTVQMIANSNFNVCRKLTGRSEGEKLPRSIRSKVVYEMVKLVGETGMAMLQQLAFSKSLNYNHRFFSVLAPKAQLGGCRDLLVQETGTKIIHAASEMFSRTLLATTDDDGLTNPKLKETILGVGLDSLLTMRKMHGKLIEGSQQMRTFYKVVCISGDNTKWGPIHCCSFFSGMIQQLLKHHPDWVSFYKIVFIKNLCRQIEIPSSSLKKIVNILKYKYTELCNLEELDETGLRSLLKETLGEWTDHPHVQFIIENYLCKGLMAMNSYNHMGQGIHHATSSLLTSIMSELYEELTIHYFKKNFPDLEVKVYHAGSSDDYAKCIIVSGTLCKDQFDVYEERFWPHVCRLRNFTTAVNRCCQMKDSAKTLTGDCFLEFYSEFMMGNRITPAVIKFIFTGLINSSVTSPSSLAQACHVSSQQAMYNSVPMLTNIATTLFRQQIFFNHVEAFIRKFGPITLGSVSQFGRLYCPRYSNLLGSSITLEDCELIITACKHVKQQDSLFSTSKFTAGFTDALKDGTGSINSDSSETSSFDSTTLLTFENDKKRLSESDLKFMEACHEAAKYTDTMEITKRVEEWYLNSKEDVNQHQDRILNSIIVNSCEWLLIAKSKCFLEVVKNLQMILRIICIGRYRSFASHGIEKVLKASLCRDENQIIEDPMIQLLPEKLRRELDRLGLSRMTVEELLPSDFKYTTLLQVVSQKLISLNVATESYSAEVSRLKQTLTARNILYGLAGGIKELSVPIYTIFLKSYFFKDNLFFELNDRWPTNKSTNYRDSTGRRLDGQVVTKYQHWLSVILNCTLSIDRTSSIDNKTLFNESLKCVDILKNNNGVTDLSIVTSHLEVCIGELSSLVFQFSDPNRKKIKVVESSPPDYEMEANKVVIVKSSLFSAVDSVKLQNNPAVVIGYLLDESSISEVKPTKIDFGSLLKDKFKISQYFPSIDKVVSQLKKDSDHQLGVGSNPDLNAATQYINYLTLLCRMLQQACSKLTVFYMIKGNTLKNEPTVTDLVSFGIKEGRYLSLPEPSLDVSTFSVKYWKILHCISAIGGLPVTERQKREILLSFLNWRVNSEGINCDCPLAKYDKSVVSEFEGHTIVDSLASETSMIKDKIEREAVVDLINFTLCPLELQKKRPFLGSTASFKHWGDGKKNGRFTYSSSTGEGTGIFVGNKLHIHLSTPSNSLVSEVERNVLSWLFHRRTEILTVEQHEIFLNLLPNLSQTGGKGGDGKPYTVCIDSNNPKLLKLREADNKLRGYILRVKKQILTVKKINRKDITPDPKLKWSKKCLSLVFDELSTDSYYHEGLIKIKKLLDDMNSKSIIPKSIISDTESEVSRIRFSDSIPVNSLALLHTFLNHSENQMLNRPSFQSSILKHYIEASPKLESRLLNQFGLKGEKKLSYNVDTAFDEEYIICKKLAKALNDNNIPVHWWSEVQQQVSYFGLTDFIMSFDGSILKGGVKWEISPSLMQPETRILDIRRLLYTLNSGVIPLCFCIYGVRPKDVGLLLELVKPAHDQILRDPLSNSYLDRLIVFTLFCFQNELKEKEAIWFSPRSLLGLLTNTTVEVGNRTTIKASPQDLNIQLKISIVCLLKEEAVLGKEDMKRQIQKSIEVALRPLLVLEHINLKLLKERFNNLTAGLNSNKEYCVSFDLNYWDSGVIDYTSCLQSNEYRSHPVHLVNFVLFLMGLAPGNSAEQMEERCDVSNSSGILDEIFMELCNSEEEVREGRKQYSHTTFFSDDEY
uniref:RNA-directed RNA polymerase L n=1 Tax=Crocidura tanakae nairovirus 1 TaxID=3139554 RepID=A0AB38ZK75_9VIRU